MSTPHEQVVRVATWPPRAAGHPSIEPCYEALAAHGIQHLDDPPPLLSAVSRSGDAVDVWHLHWPDTRWRAKGATAGRHAIRISRLLWLIARARRAGVRVAWTVDESAQDAETGVTDRVGFRALHRAVDLRIFTSEVDRAAAAERHGRGSEAIVVPIGACARRPDAAPRAELRRAIGVPPSCRALFVGADLKPSSGIDLALEALRQFPAGAYRLLVAGRPVPPHGALIAAATESRRDVHLVAARIDAQHRDDLLCASDAVLLPHRSATESSALMHALSRGRGVAAMDLPRYREVIGDSRDACSFAVRAEGPALAQAITRLFEIPADRRERAADIIADRFRWDNIVMPFAVWLRGRSQHASPEQVASRSARLPTASGR